MVFCAVATVKQLIFFTITRLYLLIPMSRMADDGGPMKMIPSSLHSSANSVFSDRNPYPGWTA